MDTGSVFLVGLFNIAAAAVVAYLLFRWISPGPETAESFWRARKWAAWVVAMLTIALLPRVINRGFDVDRFAVWVLGVVVWGGLAFLAGLMRAKAVARSTLGNSIENVATPDRPADVEPPSNPPKPSRYDSGTGSQASPLTGVSRATKTASEEHWATAFSELKGDQRRDGLWARCFALSNGVESEAQAMYLRERVQQLSGGSIDDLPSDSAARDAHLAQGLETIEMVETKLRSLGCSVNRPNPSREHWQVGLASSVKSTRYVYSAQELKDVLAEQERVTQSAAYGNSRVDQIVHASAGIPSARSTPASQSSVLAAHVSGMPHGANMVDLIVQRLAFRGYIATRSGSGWKIQEPLGGRAKVASDTELWEYAVGRIDSKGIDPGQIS